MPLIPITEVITSRPSPRYRTTDVGSEKPDLILTDAANGVKYLCYRWYKNSQILNCWKIVRVSKATTAVSGGAGFITVVATIFDYPFGCAGYNFNPDHVLKYPYNYKY